MLNILTKDMIYKLNDKDSIDGIMYLLTYEVALTKNDKPFVKGTLQSEGAIHFKAWDNTAAYDVIRRDDIHHAIVHITGSVDVYNDIKGVRLDTLEVIPESDELNYLDFMETVYDTDACWMTLVDKLKKYCSSNAMQVFFMIMDDVRVKPSFKYEFAAISHHDSCKSGLLAHTTKVVRWAEMVFLYSDIAIAIDASTFFLAAALHDVGKCVEYQHGGISEKGKIASHLTYGVEILYDYKETIIQLVGENTFDILIATIQQHHGQYGDQPRQLIPALVHIFDSVDTTLSDVNARIREDSQKGIKSSIYIRDVGGNINY